MKGALGRQIKVDLSRNLKGRGRNSLEERGLVGGRWGQKCSLGGTMWERGGLGRRTRLAEDEEGLGRGTGHQKGSALADLDFLKREMTSVAAGKRLGSRAEQFSVLEKNFLATPAEPRKCSSVLRGTAVGDSL